MLFSIYFKASHFRGSYYTIWIASQSWKFSFYIPEGPWNRESARENSNWSHNNLIIILSLSLINLTSSLLNPHFLINFSRLVIFSQINHLPPALSTHDSPRVPNISDISSIANNKSSNSTTSTLINNLNLLSFILLNSILREKNPLSLLKSSSESSFRVGREGRLFNDKLMQMISQEISTTRSPVSIINSKEWTFRPLFFLSALRF